MLKRLLIFGTLLLSLMPLSAQQKTYKEKQNYKNWVKLAPKFEDDFFKTEEAVRIGDNVLLYQLEASTIASLHHPKHEAGVKTVTV